MANPLPPAPVPGSTPAAPGSIPGSTPRPPAATTEPKLSEVRGQIEQLLSELAEFDTTKGSTAHSLTQDMSYRLSKHLSAENKIFDEVRAKYLRHSSDHDKAVSHVETNLAALRTAYAKMTHDFKTAVGAANSANLQAVNRDGKTEAERLKKITDKLANLQSDLEKAHANTKKHF